MSDVPADSFFGRLARAQARIDLRPQAQDVIQARAQAEDAMVAYMATLEARLAVIERDLAERQQDKALQLAPEVEQELLALWPTLPAKQRALWSAILDTLLPQDSGLLETLEIMEDPDTLASIQQGIQDVATGRVRPWEDVARELGL